VNEEISKRSIWMNIMDLCTKICEGTTSRKPKSILKLGIAFTVSALPM
jgi:hypothetical protein